MLLYIDQLTFICTCIIWTVSRDVGMREDLHFVHVLYVCVHTV